MPVKMMIYLKITVSFLAALIIFGNGWPLVKAALDYSSDTTIYLTSLAVNLTIKADSAADSVTVNAGNIVVSLSASTGGSFTLTSASRDLTVTQSGNGGAITQTCGAQNVTTLAITQNSGSASYTIAPTDSQCVIITSAPGGGGMPAAWYSPPTAPAGGFSLSINNGVPSAANRIITLNLKGGSDTVRMAISNSSDFKGASQEGYSQTKTWDLCSGLATCSNGQHTVYAKFYTSWGTASPVVSDNIVLESGASVTLLSGSQSSTVFARYLGLGQIGPDVKLLQAFLNGDPDTQLTKSGAGSPGEETNYFGPLTRAALIKFQEKYTEDILTPWGLTKGTGFFGKTTMAKINELSEE
jgi:hypothetical protein